MKKIIMSICIVITLCISLCSCGGVKQTRNSEDILLATQMQRNLHKSIVYLSDSRSLFNDSVFKIESMDTESCENYLKKAIKLVTDAKIIVDALISSPNFISEKLGELQVNYEKTITLLPKFSELSKEEVHMLTKLLLDGTDTYSLLYRSLNAFSYLYEFREFDKIPDADSKYSLKAILRDFGFNDKIECLETIDKQELYLIWGKIVFQEFDEDDFLDKLPKLIEHDDLSSMDCNKRWTDFIEFFISKSI